MKKTLMTPRQEQTIDYKMSESLDEGASNHKWKHTFSIQKRIHTFYYLN